MQIFINEGNQIRWNELRDEESGKPVLNATVTAQLVDSTDTNVGSPVSLLLVNGSRGDYVGTFPASDLDESAVYYLEMTAIVPNKENGFRRIPVEAMYHREN